MRSMYLAALAAVLAAEVARAEVVFTGVAAGDPTASSVILWTRAVDAAAPGAVPLTLQLATDKAFADLGSRAVTTVPARDNTVKTDVAGLLPNTRYYYRFRNAGGTVTSAVGTFKTAPEPSLAAEIKFGFSGDTHSQWRPFPAIQSVAAEQFDFFMFLGDTIYEAGSQASASLPGSAGFAVVDTSTPAATPERLLNEFRIKYREQYAPVNKDGQPSLSAVFAGQANYTLLDNHDLGNKQYIEGGAPQGPQIGNAVGTSAAADGKNPELDVNKTGKYMNQTAAYKAILQAYYDYQPIRESTVDAPGDPRSHGTPKQYLAQQWGKNLLFVNTDGRSYRDIRTKNNSSDETGTRTNNPQRTMLGATQFAWLQKSLLDAQNAGVAWKVIAVASPIDQVGPKGNDGAQGGSAGAQGSDNAKTWYGGYRAERNVLLKFIADNGIKNVVFLSTDDHLNRVNELSYFTDTEKFDQATAKRVPGCFTIVAGPLGASGPDNIKDHSFANLKTLADNIVKTQTANKVDPLGLAADYPGLRELFREGDPDADKLRQPIDFYSPDTFNYCSLRVSADGKTLSVDTYGMNSYAANTFPERAESNPMRHILGFKIAAQ